MTSSRHINITAAQNTVRGQQSSPSWRVLVHKEHARDLQCLCSSFSSSWPGAIPQPLPIPIFPRCSQTHTTMTSNTQNWSNGPWVTKPTALRVLDVLHYAYPVALLMFFVFAFSTRTILAAKAATAGEKQSPKVQFGPGGKPLPVRSHSYKKTKPTDFSRSRKLVFQWLSVFVCLTFAANATIVCVQALFKRHEGWWCGQAVTVSKGSRNILTNCIVLIRSIFRFTSSEPSSFTRYFSYHNLIRRPPQPAHNKQHGSSPSFSNWQSSACTLS